MSKNQSAIYVGADWELPYRQLTFGMTGRIVRQTKFGVLYFKPDGSRRTYSVVAEQLFVPFDA